MAIVRVECNGDIIPCSIPTGRFFHLSRGSSRTVAVWLNIWHLHMVIAGNLCTLDRHHGHPGLFLRRFVQTNSQRPGCVRLSLLRHCLETLSMIPAGSLPRCPHSMRHCSDWLHVYPDACQGSGVDIGADPRVENQSGWRRVTLSSRERGARYHRLKLTFTRCQL